MQQGNLRPASAGMFITDGRGMPQSQHLHPDHLCDDDVSLAQVHALSRIPRHISEPIQLQARQMFLHNSVVLTPNSCMVSQGHFANLSSMLTSSNSGGLNAAVDAVALSLLATRFGMFEARPLAMARYTSSIRHLRGQDLASAEGAQSLIASISLLSLYEVGTPYCNFRRFKALTNSHCVENRCSTQM